MKKINILLGLLLVGNILVKAQQPNVLYILTDDHRYDAISAFNQMLHGREMSELGYVESPETDRLTRMGTTFINTYCQATGCAPSRTSMHFGRYPFRSGVYEFEYYNVNAEHSQLSMPEQMEKLGYQTFHVGKLGVRVREIQENGKVARHQMYQTDIDFKAMMREGFTDFGKDWFYEIEGKKFDGPLKNVEFFYTPEGKIEYASLALEKELPHHTGSAAHTMEKYDLMRFSKGKTPKADVGMIISGVSPQPAGKTRDGCYTTVLKDYLENSNQDLSVGSQNYKGVDPSKPVFCHIGYDFPHTPVLPPADYRERFKTKEYKVPAFDEKEWETMSDQMRNQAKTNYSDGLSDDDKQKMIQDYYAFCAYGDALVGQSADAFIKYSEEHNQEWMIVFVCGDHGWKLNEHGAISKFTPWEWDSHNPIVVVSSDKKAFPAGKVVRDYTEFMDIAPTVLAAGGAKLKKKEFQYLDGMDLAKVVSGKVPVRDYIIGESHAVTGPRAYIRTKDYVFSMQTRPNKKRGENMNWALNATYEDLDPALYHFSKDPDEIHNLAFDKDYQEVAMKMKEKLINIVLGDNRVEVNWGPKADGTEVFRSNFAPGAHDYKLDLD